ncbi:unnamed protein product [Caenorhabditis sp. 36 PRJEB53466]|nr:unnamed protein product [Caenorhabditis sp. 36 PRJEB53466]
MVEHTEALPTLPKISFGVKKREETKVQAPAAAVVIDVEVDSDEEREKEKVERAAQKRKLTHFEGGDVQGDVDKPKQAVVIPMVVEHDWRTQKLLEKEKAGTLTEEEKAKLALVMPSGYGGADGADRNDGEKIVVEENRPDAEDADYSAVSIENFGLAILRGCDWKDGDGIGKNPQKVPLRLLERRPPGLGLGATPKAPADNKKKSGNYKEEKVEEVKKGSLIKVIDGRNKGVYGKVEARDDDSNSLFIRTAIGGKSIKVSQIVAVAVSAKEYEKDSKCLNKAAYDKEKERIESERKVHETEKPSTSALAVPSSSSSKNGSTNECPREEKLWARTDLLVRFIDEDFKRGSLYRQKVRIVDVAGIKDITIEDEMGHTHYNIRQKWLETVIPRDIGEKLMIVAGKRSGQVAVMVDKDKRREKVSARLLATNEVVSAYFEDVCAVKIRHEEDYE